MLVRGGLVVKTMRELRGYSQTELSLLYGLGKNTVGSWERGVNEPSFLEVFNIGQFLGFGIEEIYAITNDISKRKDDQGSQSRVA
jgi:DNA-binding XRE family transcriptional regulator